MKITRSTFTRKALTFGIIVFMSVALIASGFAAWLVSSGSNSEGSGNVNVEVVDQANITINVEGLEKGTLEGAQINFAPQQDDTRGYIQATTTSSDLGGITLYEQLSFTVRGDITNGGKVGSLKFSLKISDGVARAAGFVKSENDGSGVVWTYDETKAYITVPSYATDMNGNPLPKIVKSGDTFQEEGKTEPVTLTITGNGKVDVSDELGFSYKYNDQNGKYEFIAKYEFGWGAAVNGGNPGHTLDAMETSNLPNCVKKDGVYSTNRAELVIRLINAIVSEKQVNGTNAYDIIPSNLSDDQVATYITALNALQNEMTGAKMTVVIQALPK